MSANPAAVKIRDCNLRLGMAGAEVVSFQLDALRIEINEEVALVPPTA